MANNHFRASYTTLSVWESGDIHLAMDVYFKVNRVSTPAMEFGKHWHKRVEREIQATKKMPEIFGGKKLSDPQTEEKIEIWLDDWLQLVGVIDLYDDGVIYDWKTGTTSSEQWANSKQPLVYQLLKPEATRYEIHHYNQHTAEVDMSMGHLTLGTAQKAYDWVLKNSTEMFQFIKNYGGSDASH